MPKGSQNSRMSRKAKQELSMSRNVDKKVSFLNNEQDYKLDWFIPTQDQSKIVESMQTNLVTVVQAPSGCGKSATAMWAALKEYRVDATKKILLVKNPTEVGDDALGFLKGDEQEKLGPHVESMKTIFAQFMGKNKLENDLSSGNIKIGIPNFYLGQTLDNTIILIEEAQTMSPPTLKLMMERAGTNSKVVVLGDSKQTYSIKKRPNGLADLINRITYDNHGIRLPNVNMPVGYIEMDSNNNKRSDLSKWVTDLYDDL